MSTETSTERCTLLIVSMYIEELKFISRSDDSGCIMGYEELTDFLFKSFSLLVLCALLAGSTSVLFTDLVISGCLLAVTLILSELLVASF